MYKHFLTSVLLVFFMLSCSKLSPFEGKMRECVQTSLSWRNDTTGIWETAGWWNSANVLTATIRYGAVTKDPPICHRGCIRESPSLPSRRRLNRYSPLLRQLHQRLLRWRGLVGIGMDRGLQTDRREKVPRYGRDHIRWYDNRLERRLRRRHFLEEESTALQELDRQQLILPYGDPFI